MSAQSTSAPAPSRHVFVHELPRQPAQAKVRFLCCVFEYDTSKGHLLVEHAYPADAMPTPRAVVDVNLVLETVNSEMLENGRWINVIGYVWGGSEINRGQKRKKTDANGDDHVQEEYEKTMEAQSEAWKQTRYMHENIK